MNGMIKFFVLVVFVAVSSPFSAHAAAIRDDRGMMTETWFAPPSYDLRQDLANARVAGKILAVAWEQPGCVYCLAMHKTNMQEPETSAYLQEHFHFVGYNMRGGRSVTGFSGQTQSEAELSRALAVTGTPTILFYTNPDTEVTRLPGFVENPMFRGVFKYVVEKGYETTEMMEWLRARY